MEKIYTCIRIYITTAGCVAHHNHTGCEHLGLVPDVALAYTRFYIAIGSQTGIICAFSCRAVVEGVHGQTGVQTIA